MSKHSNRIPEVDLTWPQLAENLGDLYYGSLAEFLGCMADKLDRDAQADFRRDRPQLAAHLRGASDSLQAAQQSIEQAWKICQRHTKNES